MFLDARFSLDVQGSDHGTLVVSLELDECRGNTLLALAAQAEYRNAAEGAVDLFLEHGAQLNPPAGSCNHTPLLCTVLEVAKRNVETTKEFVKEIIKSKAHELIAEQLRRYCDKFSEDEVLAIKLLLGKGPDPIFWNRSGKSALIVAAGARRNDIRGVKMLLLEYVDQNIAISTTKSHVLAPTGPDDDSDGTHWAKEEPSLTIQRTLWHYYQRKVYPCPSK
ncbi:hypothetical protein N7463_005059 [Penicillium fimorum]|uniref:Ankyrin repeat-containing domain n=1 Tax=Penicillium fimorum TaxID=1882269 RepID=A0A9W9XTB9_9EURO|nr:hypothetical protein N7463_005059 [Penicillium fimorum]